MSVLNIGKLTIHTGEPRKAASLAFHDKSGLSHAWRVKMWGLGHPRHGFVGVITLSEKLKVHPND